jgi:uncharacterized protein YjbI with pentapeptide repeats
LQRARKENAPLRPHTRLRQSSLLHQPRVLHNACLHQASLRQASLRQASLHQASLQQARLLWKARLLHQTCD